MSTDSFSGPDQGNFVAGWSMLLDRRVVVMLFLGFSAGLPILLIFGTLSVWLREAGVARSMVTYFSWAALGYSFKFVWAPLVDQLKLPILTSWLGRRRGWLLVSQIAVMIAICLMASVDPADGEDALTVLAYGAVLLGFSSATQDIVIDAFRIESADARLQALLSSSYIAGYRIAMIAAGAGGLFLAEYLGSVQDGYQYAAWATTYKLMAGMMLIGVVTTLVINEPLKSSPLSVVSTLDNLRLLLLFICCVVAFIYCYVATKEIAQVLNGYLKEGLDNKVLASFLVETMRLFLAAFIAWVTSKGLMLLKAVERKTVDDSYILPIRDFFARYGAATAWLLLALIGLYRISDIVLGVISTVFYYELGFSKSEIAAASKFFGVIMTIAGGFAGGIMALRFGVLKILLLGAVLSALTNLLFILLAQTGYSIPLLYIVLGADNLSAGLASAAFVAFLSALTNIRFTAVQFAIFTSLMTLLPKIIGGYSGSIVDTIGYQAFFTFTALIGLPVIVLIMLASRHLRLETNE